MADKLGFRPEILVGLFLTGTFVMSMNAADSVDPSYELFNPAVIGEVRLEIPPGSWAAIDEEALSGCEPMYRSYHPGGVAIGAASFQGVGVRAKGGCGSSRTLDGKAAFKVNLSWDDPAVEGCPKTRKHKGLKKFTLNNQVEDASYTHERIGYDFFRKLGIPVSRAAPIRVYVNDELWGLYLNLETIDRRFLARHFDSKKGMLYEGDYGCDIGEEGCFEEKFDTDACDGPREGYDPTDKTPLRELHARLAQIPNDEFYPAIDRVFDFDNYLTMWAAATLMGNWDGYPNDPNNYRIYHDPSDDRWTLIPGGIDQLFEKNVDPFEPVGMLSVRCLADDECEAAFRTRLAEVIDEFEAGNYASMARAIAEQIRADVEADPRKEITVDEWQAAVDSTVEYIRRRPGELRELLERSERNTHPREFLFHALTDPQGNRFIYVTWYAEPGDSAGPRRWFTAKGHFDDVSATMDAVEMTGSSSGGATIGTVIVNFVDCATANFTFRPQDPTLTGHSRTAQIDSEIWKYCD